MHLPEDHLDRALGLGRRRQDAVAPAHTNGHAPAPTHWARVGAVRDD